jgi:hypothetical protein
MCRAQRFAGTPVVSRAAQSAAKVAACPSAKGDEMRLQTGLVAIFAAFLLIVTFSNTDSNKLGSTAEFDLNCR